MDACHIALGGNKGDVVTTMDVALDALDRLERVRVLRVSRVYETAPVGVDAGGVFLNAAAELTVTSSPLEMLAHLKTIEQTLGREASQRWTSRIIDLDLLLLDSITVDEPGLTIPHPHLWYRRFVLDPLAEIAFDVMHPHFGETIGALRDRLRKRPVSVAVYGGCAEDRLAVGTVLRREGVAIAAGPGESTGSLRLEFDPDDPTPGRGRRVIDVGCLPGSLVEAAEGVLTAILDEPRVHNRPLRRMP